MTVLSPVCRQLQNCHSFHAIPVLPRFANIVCLCFDNTSVSLPCHLLSSLARLTKHGSIALFFFWVFFFISFSSLSPQDPKSWFLSLPTSLRQHYSKGRTIKVQTNPDQSPFEVFTAEKGVTKSEKVIVVHGLCLSSFGFRKIVEALGARGVHVVAKLDQDLPLLQNLILGSASIKSSTAIHVLTSPPDLNYLSVSNSNSRSELDSLSPSTPDQRSTPAPPAYVMVIGLSCFSDLLFVLLFWVIGTRRGLVFYGGFASWKSRIDIHV